MSIASLCERQAFMQLYLEHVIVNNMQKAKPNKVALQ